jgi:hypothetical protein
MFGGFSFLLYLVGADVTVRPGRVDDDSEVGVLSVCVREIRCARAEKNEVLHGQQRQSGADVIGMIYGEVVTVRG